MNNLFKLASFFEYAVRRYEKENISEKEFISLDNYVQPKNWLLSLKRFVSSIEDPEYYIRYSNIPSLTINPRFEKANLLGIYAFAFTRPMYLKLLSNELGLIFDEAKYILIFKPKDKSKILNKINYTIKDFINDINKIKELYFPTLSTKGQDIFNNVVKNSFSYFDNERFFLLFFEELRSEFAKEDESGLPFGKEIYDSSKLLMDLGYQGLYNGKEAVFFSGSFTEDPLIFDNPSYKD